MLMMVMVLTMAGCGGSSEEAPAEEPAETEQTEEQAEEPAAEPIGIHHAEIVIKDFGTVKVELDGDKAPITVQNFMDLANKGFYDGLTFHRIMEGFMKVQAIGAVAECYCEHAAISDFATEAGLTVFSESDDNIMKKAWNATKEFFTKIWEWLKALVKSVINFFTKSFFVSYINITRRIISNLYDY